MVKLDYNEKIELFGTHAYDDISSFLSKISFETNYTKVGVNYILNNKDKEAIAKMNLKKNTIELTDKVEEWIVDSINEINRQQKKR